MTRNATTAMVLCLILLATGGCAEVDPTSPLYDPVLPGNAAVDASRMAPHKITYTKRGGKMLYDMQRFNLEGRDVWRLFVHFNAMSDTPDTMYFDADTLAYAARKLTMEDYVIEVAVDGQARKRGQSLRDSPLIPNRNFRREAPGPIWVDVRCTAVARHCP